MSRTKRAQSYLTSEPKNHKNPKPKRAVPSCQEVVLTSDGWVPNPKLRNMKPRPNSFGAEHNKHVTYVYVRRGLDRIQKLAKKHGAVFELQPVRTDHGRLACVVYHTKGQHVNFEHKGKNFKCSVEMDDTASKPTLVLVCNA